MPNAGRPAAWNVTADDVAIELRQEFIREEMFHRLRAIGVPVKEPLGRYRALEGV
jgi:ferritin-like protein